VVVYQPSNDFAERVRLCDGFFDSGEQPVSAAAVVVGFFDAVSQHHSEIEVVRFFVGVSNPPPSAVKVVEL